MRKRAVALGTTLCVGVAIASWSPLAAAQDAPSTDDRNEAGKDFADGDRAFKAGDYRAAAQAYEAAYKLMPHHAALWNAARSWHRAGDLPRAANLYAQYLQEAPASARDRNNALKALKELSPKLAHLEIHATDVQGVKVDGAAIRGTDVYVTPGAHVVEGQTRDGRAVRQSQNADGGQTVSVALVAPDVPAVPAPAQAAPPPEEPRSSKKWSPIVVYFGGAVTLVLAGVTVWSGVDTLQRKDTFDKAPTQANLDVGMQTQTRTNVLIAATAGVGVLTAAAAVFLVDWHGSSGPERDGSPPAAGAIFHDVKWGAGPGSLVVQGSF
jgi:hypothetical protein